MSGPTLTIDNSPSPDDIGFIAQAMRRHALSQINGAESPPVACFLRENGVIVGGIVSRVIQHRMIVDLLWVDETRRNRGFGSSLLQSMEGVARDRGCRDVLLETLSTSAARLYTAAGYRQLAQVPDYIAGFTKRVLLKSLA
jgi:ribosomal protein S18 acetylase RimI-like enzyme